MAKPKIVWNADRQAQEIVRPRMRLKQEKPKSRAEKKGKFYSVASAKKAKENLKRVAQAMRRQGVTLKEITTAQAQKWINQLPDRGMTQKSISAYKTALELCPQVEAIKAPRAIAQPGPKATLPRATTPERAALIFSHQREPMRLTSEIVSDAGLRAAEVLTLRRLDRVPDDDPARGKMARRPWDEQRWEGRDGVRYLVIGKNGLPREIVLRADLADRLEARHLDVPREITDRDVRISQHYNIPGGQAWSQSFTDAAHRALGAGNSPGGHALRHAFAHDRMDFLLDQGLPHTAAEERIAQEMGHFRPSSTPVYLR